MDRERLRGILEGLRDGKMDVEECLGLLTHLPFEELNSSTIDYHRPLRKGIPEVIYGESKTEEELIEIVEDMSKRGENVLITRLSPQKAERLSSLFKEGIYYPRSRVFMLLLREVAKKGKGKILVISAGTSDAPVAEEALLTLRFLGDEAESLLDVGVAGIHRILGHLKRLREARVIIVVAGMEGALPSIVAGLVSVPVIAVPTSIGYGASFGGISALLCMLNTCAQGVAVVNIDNGFGAACLASIINGL
ncbi:MAG: nickel pincer cofactor biosynthesis protein LarB [Desulfatiglandales bacterium]